MRDKLNSCAIIVPVYNEVDGISTFHQSLVKSLSLIKPEISWHIIYINDGSTDKSIDKLLAISKMTKNKVTVLDFSRNFGKEAAVSAGIQEANKMNIDCAVILDSDGQHPVTRIADFIKQWRSGAEVVIGVRGNSKHESLVKKFGSKFFYVSFNRLTGAGLTPRSTDFRLIDNQVIAEFSKLTERGRITRGLIDWLGFKRSYIEFDALDRQHGEASYSTKKLFQLALNSFVSLSMVPLYFSGYIGLLFMIASFITGCFILIEQFILADPLSLNFSGPTILGVILVFLVGIILSSIGLLALYIAKILEEAQNRPLYIVRSKPMK